MSSTEDTRTAGAAMVEAHKTTTETFERVAMVLEVTMAVEAKWCKDDTKLVDITIIKDNTKLGDLCTPPPPATW